MSGRLLWRNFDWPLMIAVLILTGTGVAFVYSATDNTIDLSDLWIRQVIFAVVGLVALVLVAAFDYRHLELLAPPAFVIFVGLLLAVFFVGETQGSGSQRWINVAGTLVQPTEPGKFMLIVFMAWYLSWFHDRLHRLDVLLVAVVLLAGPLALIYLQPDLGMTITYAFLGGTLILVGGIRYWQLFLMGGSIVAVIPILFGTLQGYMLERIDVFLNPESNPDGGL